ncbi:MAG: hypothetical protein ACI8RD_010196 [Bacillariaceae sp.]|jgi:hypothetical protein
MRRHFTIKSSSSNVPVLRSDRHYKRKTRKRSILFMAAIAMIGATIMKTIGINRSGALPHQMVVNAFSWNTRSYYYTPSICKSGNKIIIRDNNMMFRFQSSKLRQNTNPIHLSRTHRLFFHTSSSPASIIPHTRGIILSAMEDEETTIVIDVDRTWNVGGLRKEVSRLTVRCHKKVGKANQRLLKAQEEVDRLTGSEGVTMEELEKCPNVDEFEKELEELRSRLTQLNQLEVLLQDIKGKKTILPDHIATLAIKLEVQDETPTKPERGPKKEKGPTTMAAFRLPYRRFYTSDKTEIRVSK